MRTMRSVLVFAAVLALVAVFAWPANGTATGFTVTPPSTTVGSNLTITASLTGGTETCDGIGLRVERDRHARDVPRAGGVRAARGGPDRLPGH